MQEQEIQSVIEYFYEWEKNEPDRIFLRQPSADEWTEMSFGQAGRQARKMVSALYAKGLKPGDQVGIYSKNCSHWFLADLAIMIGGFVSVPFYASLPKDQLQQVIELSDLKALFVGRLDKWGDRGEAIPEDLNLITFPHHRGDPIVDMGESWDELIEKSPVFSESPVPNLDDLWTIKFTSGTTGIPKGVMLSHRCPARVIADEIDTDWIGLNAIEDHSFFSFLPLNHVAERIAVLTFSITVGGRVSFAENLERFAINLRESEPTFLFAVPRIWTLFYQGVTEKIPEKKLQRLLKLPIIGKLVRKKVLRGMGLHNLQAASTGAAITPAFIKEFYQSLGIHLIEAYGMTETTGSFTNSPDPDTPSDSVGRPIPYAEIKIDPDTNEILMKTPYIMMGYYNEPEKTAEALRDGWMHSGDVGRVDDQGYVYVTGRIKDAFKTAKGSFVTPNPLEEAIMENEHVEQVCVVGLGIPQPIALINLSDAAKQSQDSSVAQSIQQTISALNDTRANFEKISTAVIQSETWTPENGILTPTMKIKRSELDNRFAREYLAWHEAGETIIWA